MAIEFWDSFDNYTDVLTWWTNRGGSSLPSVSAGNGRNSTASIRLSPGGNIQSWIAKTLASSVQTRIVGFAVKFSTFSSVAYDFLSWRDAGSFQCYLQFNLDGTLSLVRSGGTVLGTTTFSLQVNQFYYLETKIKIDPSVGTFDLKINGDSKLSLSSINTRATANSTSNEVTLGNRVNNNTGVSINIDCDDLVILNTSGSVANDFIGDVRVQSTFPSGAGTTAQWTPSTGSNFQNVDDNPPNDDTDYNSSSTAGQYDTYAMGDITPTSGSVIAAATRMRARKDDAGTRTIAAAIRTNSNDYFGTNQNVGTTYAYYGDVWDTNPNTSAAFTVTEINSIEVGVKLIA